MTPTYDFAGQVALVDRNEAKLRATLDEVTSAGGKAIAIVCDVADEAQAKDAIERTVAAFGRLDMAYNNAGILGPMCPLVEENGAGFDEVTAVNLRGIWTFLKHELIPVDGGFVAH